MDTLRDALRSLAETVAEWDMLGEDGKQEWGVSALLASAKLKAGVCEYAYSRALAEKLHDPQVFALINLNIQRRFNSGHGLALYENCYRFVRTGSTGWWPLEVFRKLMGVDDSEYYEAYKHLNAKIIKPAVAEVNKTSDIEITPETRKKGRAVTDIRFLIKQKSQMAMFNIDDEDGVRAGAIYKRLRGQGVSDKLARQWISENGENYVAEKLDYVEGRKAESPASYLSAAIARDYTAPKPEPVSAEALAAVTAHKAREAEKTAAEDARAAERADRAGRFAAVQAAAMARNPTQRDADKRLFMARLTGDLEREDFRRHGWASALNAREIFAFWEEMQPGLFEG